MAELRKKPKNRRVPAKAGAAGMTMTQRLSDITTWREGFDPVRGLTMPKLLELLAGTTRGEYAELMWLLAAPNIGVETIDPDLYALIERRTSALAQMEWKVSLVADTTAGFDGTLAGEQAAALRQTYERIDNFYALVTHLALANFRGVAAAEKLYDGAGDIAGFTIVEPWNLCRTGFTGPWSYNPSGNNVSGRFLSEDFRIDTGSWALRTVARPLAPLALRKFVRGAFAERDWDAFVEIYGVPGGVVVGPPNIPEDKEKEYEHAAEEIAKGGSGFLPNGADYKPNDGPRGSSPFRERLEWLQKQLILAGTGGQCSMLEGAAGLGKGSQSQAHEEVFMQLARRDARSIGEELNRAIDREVLGDNFAGRPRLAYWTLALNEEPSSDAAVDRIAKLAVAGYRVDPEEVAEVTGHKVTVIAPAKPGPEVPNRESEEPEAKPSAAYIEAVGKRIAPITELLDRLPDADSPEWPAALEELRERADELMDDDGMAGALAEAMADGVSRQGPEVANMAPNQPRGNPSNAGRWYNPDGSPKHSGAKERATYSPYDPARAEAVQVHGKVAAHLGLGSGAVHFDAEELLSKHPKEFKSVEDVRTHVRATLTNPTHIIPGNTRGHELILQKLQGRVAVLDVRKKDGQFRVISAYPRARHKLDADIVDAELKGNGFTVKNSEAAKGAHGPAANDNPDVSAAAGLSPAPFPSTPLGSSRIPSAVYVLHLTEAPAECQPFAL